MLDSEVLLKGAEKYLVELKGNKVSINTYYARIKRAKGVDNMKYLQLKLALCMEEVSGG